MEDNSEIQVCAACSVKFVSESRRCPCCGAAQPLMPGESADGMSESQVLKNWLLIVLIFSGTLFALLSRGHGIFEGAIEAGIVGGMVGAAEKVLSLIKPKVQFTPIPVRNWREVLLILLVIGVATFAIVLVLHHYSQPG